MFKQRNLLREFTFSNFFVPFLNLLGGISIIILFNMFDAAKFKSNLQSGLVKNTPLFVKEQSKIINQFTKHSQHVIQAMADSYDMELFLAQGNQKELAELLKTAISAESYLMQMRFIDDAGVEVIRFDRSQPDGEIYAITGEKLQNKSKRDYVMANLQQPSRIWFSSLDLNIEHKKVEIPFKPTFRVVLPIWHHEQFRGMLVMNYFAAVMLSGLFESSSYDAQIIDADEYILYSTKPQEAWSRFQNPPFKSKPNDHSVTMPLKTLFANELWMKVTPNQQAIKQKVTQERDHIFKISILILMATVIISILIYFVLRRLQLKLENSKEQLKIKTKLLDQERENSKMNQLIDKHVIMSTTDLTGKITYASTAFSEISGYSKEELVGQQHNILRDPDMPAGIYRDLWDTVKQNHTWRGELKNRCKDGGIYWVRCIIGPLYDSVGRKVGYSAIRSDITDKIELEEKEHSLEVAQEELTVINENLQEEVRRQVETLRDKDKILIQQSKLASMGEMMANIAHQWKQPLMMLSMSLIALKKKFTKGLLDEDYMAEYAKSNAEIIKRMNNTIVDFSSYFAPDKEKTSFHLDDGIHQAIRFLEPIAKRHSITVSFQCRDCSEVMTYRGHESELGQVILNLIKNSIDAIAANGIQEGVVSVMLQEMSREWRITVHDNGGGIPLEIMDRIFEPYFTTKFKSDGTGIGLYMSKMIIEDSFQGRLEAKNEAQGATFLITLPKEE